MNERASRPLSDKMLAEIEAKNMDKDSPILIRTFKEESELEVWKQDRSGRFALLKTYPICRWSGELGPKIKEGDRQAPEGFYTITPAQMNPNSQYYLSFDLGYPNAFDRAHGRTGANLMVHGDCSSRGCYSMTDEQVAEIYALGRDSFFGGQKSFQVQAYPFRMTPQNLARHRNNPHMAFWKMLKRGYDHFEVTRLEPKVDVCEKRYVFDAQAPGDPSKPLSFNPTGKCPAFEVPEEIATAVQEKQQRDEMQFAELVRRGTPTAPIRSNVDGGMHRVFVEAVKRNEIGVAPAAFSLASVPGTIPATVRPPQIPELADAPIMHGVAPPQSPPSEPAARTTKVAAAKPADGAKEPGFFGSLFSSTTSASEHKDDTALDKVARLIGLRGSDGSTTDAAVPAPKPKPKPAVRQASTAAPGAIRPKPVDEQPARDAAAERPPAPVSAPTPQPVPPTATALAPAASGGAISGAAPVRPAGSFESRWSAFR